MVTAILVFWHIYIGDLNGAWILRACSKFFVILLMGVTFLMEGYCATASYPNNFLEYVIMNVEVT